jgi:hypothetical protein
MVAILQHVGLAERLEYESFHAVLLWVRQWRPMLSSLTGRPEISLEGLPCLENPFQSEHSLQHEVPPTFVQ